jgi:hypothetical protein
LWRQLWLALWEADADVRSRFWEGAKASLTLLEAELGDKRFFAGDSVGPTGLHTGSLIRLKRIYNFLCSMLVL